jgi:hypothetical protein
MDNIKISCGVIIAEAYGYFYLESRILSPRVVLAASKGHTDFSHFYIDLLDERLSALNRG